MKKYDFDKQHQKHKLHAYERIMLLLDKDSFTEISTDFDDSNCAGVIAGRGTIEGKPVFVFSQDFTVSGGSIGLNHGLKIAYIIETAVKEKCPIIGIYDSVGACITEGVKALAGCGEIIKQNIQASGVIPQIAVIVGPCAGAAAYSSAMCDFVFTVNEISQLYITGNKVIESVTGEKCNPENLGDAKMQSSISGVAHFLCKNEKECFFEVRELISALGSSNDGKYNRSIEGYISKSANIAEIVPKNGRLTYSMPKFIEEIFDENSFVEVHRHFAQNIVVGFAKLSGITVGIVANNPKVKAGCLDVDSSDKAARFVRFCDAFSIPIVTFTDTPGYLPGVYEEHAGIIRHGAKLLFAYTEATTTKVTVIIRKAFGGAYIAMGSKHAMADFVYATPYAEIAVMGAEAAVSVLHRKKLENPIGDVTKLRNKLIKEYKEQYITACDAVAEGYVDGILDFADIRKQLYDDIMKLQNKHNITVLKKHGNIPL